MFFEYLNVVLRKFPQIKRKMPRVSLSRPRMFINEIDSINKKNYNIKINEASKTHSGSATFGNRKDKNFETIAASVPPGSSLIRIGRRKLQEVVCRIVLLNSRSKKAGKKRVNEIAYLRPDRPERGIIRKEDTGVRATGL